MTVDGLFTTNYGVTTFAVQFVRAEGGKWRGANGFVRQWAEERGLEAKDKKARRWMRNDETILELIEEQGVPRPQERGNHPLAQPEGRRAEPCAADTLQIDRRSPRRAARQMGLR